MTGWGGAVSIDSRASAHEIKRQLAARSEDFCRTFLGGGRRVGAEWVVGDVHGKPGDSVGVHLIGDKAGVWKDFADCEKGGDLLDLIMRREGLSCREAIHRAQEWLGHSVPETSVATAPGGPDRNTEQERRAWAERTWSRTVGATRTPVENYLRSRGIVLPIPVSLRYCSHLLHKASGTYFPAMVAKVEGPDGALLGIHRTFLKEDGSGKAPVEKPKMALGPVAGGAVRLAAVGRRLGVSEGIETGLSAAQLCPGLPVWSALSASGLNALQLPAEVREVIILADGDDPGERAAQDAAHRFHREGRVVRIARPLAGLNDFNDFLRAAGLY